MKNYEKHDVEFDKDLAREVIDEARKRLKKMNDGNDVDPELAMAKALKFFMDDRNRVVAYSKGVNPKRMRAEIIVGLAHLFEMDK